MLELSGKVDMSIHSNVYFLRSGIRLGRYVIRLVTLGNLLEQETRLMSLIS